jgi:molybdopterin/thiamine biosynthesis adenylyltransferase
MDQDMFMTRYQRQMQLPEVGKDGQAKLAKSHVLVVGAGGLGSPVLLYLAGAGIGSLTIIDPDHVEESNLHRQPLFDTNDIGHSKALRARDHLLARNRHVVVQAKARALAPNNVSELVTDANVVVDAADSFAVSYILSDMCLALKKPLISASVLEQAGYVGGFCGPAPSLRAVFPEPPTRVANCVTAGVLGPVVGMIGATQAQMVLATLLGQNQSPLGQLVRMDGKGFAFSSFSFLGAQEPKSVLPFVARSDLVDDDLVVELRDEIEAPEPIVASAMRRDLTALDMSTFQQGRRIVLACQTGLRAWRGAKQMQAQGHHSLALMAACAC